PNPAARIELAYRRAFGRWPTNTETAEATAYLARCEAAVATTDLPADQRLRQSWASFCRTLFSANEFLFVD
ncbi:MAG: hypothetical protein ACO37F_13280, partial [Pirellulales bacterium]